MMREEHVKNNTVTKVCPAFDSRSNQCTQKRENKRRRRQCEEERKKTNEKRERESVCVVGRTFWFVARLLDAFLLPAHYYRRDVNDDDDTTRLLDERDDFLCGMHFFLFFLGQKK